MSKDINLSPEFGEWGLYGYKYWYGHIVSTCIGEFQRVLTLEFKSRELAMSFFYTYPKY